MAKILARWQALSMVLLLPSLGLIGTLAVWMDDAQIVAAQSGKPITVRSILEFLFGHREYLAAGRGDVCAIAPISVANAPGEAALNGVCTDLISSAEVIGVAPLHSKTQTVEKVWAAQPLFLWKGKAGRIQVRKKGAGNVLWQKSLTEKDWHIRYQGKPLQPGQTYMWELLDPDSSSVAVIVPFQVMTDAEQQQVDKALTRIEDQLRQQKASPETFIRQRAHYFAQRQLVSDALGEMMKVSGSAANFDQWRSQILAKADCGNQCAKP